MWPVDWNNTHGAEIVRGAVGALGVVTPAFEAAPLPSWAPPRASKA